MTRFRARVRSGSSCAAILSRSGGEVNLRERLPPAGLPAFGAEARYRWEVVRGPRLAGGSHHAGRCEYQPPAALDETHEQYRVLQDHHAHVLAVVSSQ